MTAETRATEQVAADVARRSHNHYNPVTVTPSSTETIGAIFLGLLSLILLVALLRAQKRTRELTEQVWQARAGDGPR